MPNHPGSRLPGPINLPPFWLAVALACVWAMDRLFPMSLFGEPGRWVGVALALIGAGLLIGAALQMMRHRTTFIPGRDPAHLVKTGFFRLSRNPIYLGDALILSGAVLYWDVPLGVVIVILFMALIQHRFILAEESRLQRLFPAEYRQWSEKTGRWIG